MAGRDEPPLPPQEQLSKNERKKLARRLRREQAKREQAKRRERSAGEGSSGGGGAAEAAVVPTCSSMVVFGGAKSTPVPWEMLEAQPVPKGEWGLPVVEREHVQVVYDSIARQWHGTRYKAWPKVAEFIHSLPRCALVADVGCGNGKNMPSCRANGGLGIGIDFSLSLVEICVEQGLEAGVADALRLPLRSDCFDAALNIAVLHHISTPARRVRTVEETLRVVKVGGSALFYAWAKEQAEGTASGHRFASADVLVPFHLRLPPSRSDDRPSGRKRSRKDPAHDGESRAPSPASAAACAESSPPTTVALPAPPRAETGPGASTADSAAAAAIASGAAAVDGSKRSAVFQRFCHVYRAGELEALFQPLVDAGWVRVERAYFDTGNWCVVAKKVAKMPEPAGRAHPPDTRGAQALLCGPAPPPLAAAAATAMAQRECSGTSSAPSASSAMIVDHHRAS